MPDGSTKTPAEKTATFLDAGSKGVIVVYGIGYFIESFFDSRFGVGYLNPLRSRVGFTGISFAVQVLTILLLVRLEDLSNFTSSYWMAMAKKAFPAERRLLLAAFMATWVAESGFIAILMRLFFGTSIHLMALHVVGEATGLAGNATASRSESWDDLKWPLLAGLGFFLVATGRTLALNRKIRSSSGSIVTLIGGVLFIGFEAYLRDTTSTVYFLWVVLIRCGYVLYRRDPHFENPLLRVGVFGMLLMVPIIYGWQIYEQVRPAWGGAAKTQVRIQFEREVPPFGTDSPVFLLEETEEGFYLIPSDEQANGHIAVYVPRRDVREVRYEQVDR